METLLRVMEGLHIGNRDLGGEKRANCQLTNIQIFRIVMLMPFFAIKGFSHYGTSVLTRMFGGKKDILYDFMAQDNINFRNLSYNISTNPLAELN